MKKFSQIVEKACPSKLINAWKLKIDSKCYLITPAHVAIYKKDDKWLISRFLKDLHHYNWRIPVKYLSNSAHEDNFAWAEVTQSQSDQNFLELSNEEILGPTNVDFFFRQPYSANGKLVENPSFASINGVVYPSPESELLEALDIGFRGMSGALALKQGTPEVVGMFVGRGTALGLELGAKLPDFVETRFQEKDIGKKTNRSEDIAGMRPFRNIVPQTGTEVRESELFACEESISDLDIIFGPNSQKGDKTLTKIDDRLESLDDKLDYLLQNTIMKHDLRNLLSVVAMRRGLLISNQSILERILKSQPVEIKSFAKFQNRE